MFTGGFDCIHKNYTNSQTQGNKKLDMIPTRKSTENNSKVINNIWVFIALFMQRSQSTLQENKYHHHKQNKNKL